MDAHGVETVAFDVNDTVFSLDRLGPAFREIGLGPGRGSATPESRPSSARSSN